MAKRHAFEENEQLSLLLISHFIQVEMEHIDGTLWLFCCRGSIGNTHTHTHTSAHLNPMMNNVNLTQHLGWQNTKMTLKYGYIYPVGG